MMILVKLSTLTLIGRSKTSLNIYDISPYFSVKDLAHGIYVSKRSY
jgi:hypothetical protein